MEDTIQEVKTQMLFYSARYNASNHILDKDMLNFYKGWLNCLIEDQKKLERIFGSEKVRQTV